jgi:flotillin
VRESQLAQHQRQLEIQRTQQESEIAQRAYFVKLEADTDSRSSQARAEAEMIAEMARINKDRDTRTAQLASDETLRKAEMKSVLVIDEARIENGIKLARKRAEEAVEKAREEASRAQVILAAEDVQAQKERVIAEREHEIAQMRQKKELLLEDAQIKNEINTLLARAKAKASAATMESDSQRERMEAEAAGKAALFAAENSMSESLVRLRLEERKLDRMPEIMTQMMKPVEKIESIRINQIAGLGSKSDGGEGGVDSAFGSAMDQILGMAVRLPAMRQMGEEIGLDFDANLAGRTADYANRIKSKKDDKG